MKYNFPAEMIPELRRYIAPYADLDPYAAEMSGHAYTVRSIYYDTENLDFYYHKLDGLKIRRKLRMRAYNQFYPDKPVFLEIKRRYENRIVKERVNIPLSAAGMIHDEHKRPDGLFEDNVRNRTVMKKYLYNLIHFDLKPSALIVYEREAHIGKINSHERLTIDKNLRSYAPPVTDDLFREDDLRPMLGEKCILELKYDNYMPKWMGRLVHEFGIRAEPIPKYCLGIETWKENVADGLELTARDRSLN